MRVLVAYASKTGFTKGIAEFISKELGERGAESEALPIGEVGDLSKYDAFVVGSAVYMGRWMKEAREFVLRNKVVLGAKPTWLFSSGPVGTSKTDKKGRDLLEVSGPTELEELRDAVHPRGHQVFFGGFDGSRLTGATGFFYRMATHSKSARESMPEGDFRDWNLIGAWADSIAGALALAAHPQQ